MDLLLFKQVSRIILILKIIFCINLSYFIYYLDCGSKNLRTQGLIHKFLDLISITFSRLWTTVSFLKT
jgi:hypothetical protein